MNDNFQLYIKHKKELDDFEGNYFDLRKEVYSIENIDDAIKKFEKLIEESKDFELRCKDIGLSEHVREMYKNVPSSKGTRNLFKEDRNELKRLMLLKRVIKKINRLSLEEIQEVDDCIKIMKQPKQQIIEEIPLQIEEDNIKQSKRKLWGLFK